MKRREFVQKSCLACGAWITSTLAWSSLTSCNSLPKIVAKKTTGRYILPLTSFVESPILIIQREDAEFDALVVKTSLDQYHTLEMKCSHQNQPLTATLQGLHCASHGSRFSLEGMVEVEPATRPIARFKTNLVEEHLEIDFNHYITQ